AVMSAYASAAEPAVTTSAPYCSSASLIAAVDYGDGSGVMPLALNGNAFSLSHEYPDEGGYTVTVIVTDGEGAEGVASVQVEVRLRFPTLPGMNLPARDLNGDGRADDMNGNGRLDFADVVLLFIHLQSPEVQSDAELFDLNSNGRVDTADVIFLFRTLV
ncbi:MAG: PKD domain-containing protein, partial [Chloroflexi bacterium]|nr:PKD domain-containing protein [Chloroflexota bacterium]